MERAFVLAAIVVVVLLLRVPIREFTDPDALYHLRHAWILRTRGIFTGEFPWVRFSAIEREASDLWYGFHVLLVPFTFGEDLMRGVELAGLAVPIACLALVCAAFARLGIRRPLFWTLAFAFLTGDGLFRITMVRPHPISLGLALLLFAFACEERPPRAAVILCAALLAWTHLALAWVALLVFAAVAGARHFERRRPPLAWAGWTALGLAAGALARPNPLGGIRLASIQVATWLATRGAKVPLDVGRELKPFGWVHFETQLLPAAVLVATACALALRRGGEDAEERVKLRSTLALLAVFAAMTFAVARRSNDFLVAFAAVAAGLSTGRAWDRAQGFARAALALIVLGSVATAAAMSVDRYRGYASTVPGPDRLKEAALWLRDHAEEGDVVFNAHWDQFAPLFFWNPRCRCVNGNDPIFLYAYDRRLYGIAHQLETDEFSVVGGRACVVDAAPGDTGPRIELRTALSERFQARWVLVQKARTPKLSLALRSQRGFELAFETAGEAIFETGP